MPTYDIVIPFIFFSSSTPMAIYSKMTIPIIIITSDVTTVRGTESDTVKNTTEVNINTPKTNPPPMRKILIHKH